MEDPKKLFLMLIKVTEAVRHDPALVGWMDEIEADYMGRYGMFGRSIDHLALHGPWQFALVFPGSQESAAYLQDRIASKAPGQTEFLTMEGEDLDHFKARRRSPRK